MHDIDFLESLYKQLREEIETRTEQLASGSASSMEQYNKVVGEISGFSQSIDIVRQTLLKGNRDE